MNTALIVVDVQNGFLSPAAQHVVEPISRLIDEADRRGVVIAFTRFFNHPDSGWVKWIRWSRLMGSPETDIVPALAPRAKHVFDKVAYGAFVPEFNQFIESQKIERVVICGIATDGCVLKTAVDAFERGIQPIVVADACASHAGNNVHEAGLLLISRFIGKQQVVSLDEVLKLGFNAESYGSGPER